MEWFNVGRIVNTHGVRGEVRVIPVTDFEEERFRPGNVLYVGDRPLTVKAVRPHKQFQLLTFEEVTSLDQAQEIKDTVLQIPETERGELADGEFYYSDIIGCEVWSDEGDYLGKIKEILSPGANDVWVLSAGQNKKDILLPYIDDVVKKIDIESKRIEVHVLEGLLS